MQNNDHFDITIPIRGYLKKFIAQHACVDPFVILNRCHFSGLFMEPIKKGYIRTPKIEKKHLNDRITLRMLPAIQKENKFTIDNQTIMLIDHRLKSLFDQQLYAFVQINSHKIGDRLTSLEAFLQHYKISEDDLKLETAIKTEYRIRQDEKERTRPHYTFAELDSPEISSQLTKSPQLNLF